jgi:rhamnulokinase
VHVAIDLGAGSGRAVLGRFAPGGLFCREVHRFQYPPRQSGDHLRWDWSRLREGVELGLCAASAAARELGHEVESAGVDSWAVDYSLLDGSGRLLEEPVCYRDPARTSAMEEVLRIVPREALYARTGIQFLPFNTVFQLYAHAREGLPPSAARLLMIPDLLHTHLGCAASGEYTNASSTGLLGAKTRQWDDALFAKLALPREIMPDLVEPGTMLGELKPAVRERLSLPAVRVVAPATHDTGSAVAGTPLRPGWAYVSSGTWSLVGVERSSPLLTPEAAAASFTNEGGVFGTIRFLKNVMGLWILESCRKEWAAAGQPLDIGRLLHAASRLEAATALVDPDDSRFFNPPSMLEAVRSFLEETGQPPVREPAHLTRVIVDSLALRYTSVLQRLQALTGERIAGVHVVGGGCRNDLLNQATADATGLPVECGPVEATALGNLSLQSIALGHLGSLAEAREVIARHAEIRRFEPTPGARARWDELRLRYALLEA